MALARCKFSARAASLPPVFTRLPGGRHGCPCTSQTGAAHHEGYGEDAKVAHRPNSPRTVGGDRVRAAEDRMVCPGSSLTSRSTTFSDPTVGPPAEISAPEHLAHSIGRSRRSGRFRSTSHAVSGAALTPRDRARDRGLQTVENARSAEPGEHPGMRRPPLQPVQARRNGRPNPARDGRLGSIVGASSVIRRCSTLDLKSADAM